MRLRKGVWGKNRRMAGRSGGERLNEGLRLGMWELRWRVVRLSEGGQRMMRLLHGIRVSGMS